MQSSITKQNNIVNLNKNQHNNCYRKQKTRLIYHLNLYSNNIQDEIKTSHSYS